MKNTGLPSPGKHVRSIYKFSPHTASSTHHQFLLFISACEKGKEYQLYSLTLHATARGFACLQTAGSKLKTTTVFCAQLIMVIELSGVQNHTRDFKIERARSASSI